MSRGPSFDGQASTFDRRAGLPSEVADRVAEAVRECATSMNGRLVVEIGAGTGEIGGRLARTGQRYLGMDLSASMLAVFRERSGAHLLQADARADWPIVTGRAGVVFLARAAHLLDPAHLIREASRIAHPAGAVLLLGAVRRERESLRAALRREMHRLLASRGIEPRRGRQSGKKILAAFEERGGQRLASRTVASWRVVERPVDSLDAWRSKPGLAGRAIGAEVKLDILDRLEAWSQEKFGGLEIESSASERYELAGAHIA